MNDIEAGQLIQQVKTLIEEVGHLRKEVAELQSRIAYGRGALWGLLTIVGLIASAVGFSAHKLVH